MLVKDILKIIKALFLYGLLGFLMNACSEPIIISPDAVLPDGSVYSGDVRDGKFQGQGTLKYEGGDYYQGNFKQGIFHGEGLFVSSDGISYQGVFHNGSATGRFIVLDERSNSRFEGELKDWLYHGQGEYSSAEFEYKGRFLNGLLDGSGFYTLADGSTYDGEFSKGNFSGYGKYISSTGDQYEGEFSDGFYSGKGEYKNEEGERYVGQFENGKYHGAGQYYSADGWMYNGEFLSGTYNGHGVYKKDDISYVGDFVDGVLSGNGRYTDYAGSVYEGEVKDWFANGRGKLISADGVVSIGQFEQGALSGFGKKTFSDRSVYEGEFLYGEPHGFGKKVFSNGSVYSGEFSYGKYSGRGSLKQVGEDDNLELIKGRWKNGKLVHNEITGERYHEQAELALQYHQTLLDSAISNMPTGREGRPEMFFVGVAGDGRQSVFKREVNYVSSLIKQRYSLDQRYINLINHHHTAQKSPLATRRSLAAALDGVRERMNIDEDILFLYMTSHGSRDHEFILSHNSIKLPSLGASELRTILDESQIKWRVLVISACYSGGFLDELKSNSTLILTAAAADRKSFGCSEDSEMTYFARALFKEVLAENLDITIPDAFAQAKELIAKWENSDGFENSIPQMHAPPEILEKLKAIKRKKDTF